MKPLGHVVGDGDTVVEEMPPAERDDQDREDEAEVHPHEHESDEIVLERGGIATFLWGLLRGIAGSRNSEDRADKLDAVRPNREQ